MYEDNFNVCTSFNVNLFYHTSQQSYHSLPKHFLNSKCFIYHENSFDLKRKNKEIDFTNVPNNVVLIDLYKENPWLENFIENSTFRKLTKDHNYWNRNSQYWFRKVVSIVNFINYPHDKEYGIWCDCDTYVVKSIDDVFFNYIKNYDWCCNFRFNNQSCSIETGIQIFKLNEKTKEFSKKYLEYFISERVFKEEKIYADNFVLNSCFNKFGKNLSLGKLNTKESFNMYEYINHKKGTLFSVRENK